MNAREEEWRTVAGFEGYYEVSSLGRVRSIDREVEDGRRRLRRLKGRVLNPGLQTSGYRQVHLMRDGVDTPSLVHRLVLIAFSGPPPEGAVACHGNGDRGDNRAANLRWGTMQENTADAVEHGTHNGARTHCPQGHPYSGPNLGVNNVGKRFCRTCARELSRRKGHPPVSCGICGTPIPRPPRGRPRKWCGAECRAAAKKERLRMNREAAQ